MFLDIIKHLHSEGFPISDFTPDGKIHRFEIEKGDRRAGFYIAHRNYLIRTGEEYFFVQYGSWRSGELKSFSTLKGIMQTEDRQALEKQIQKDKKAFETEKKKEWEQVAEEVKEKWERLSPNGTSDYLIRKKISECPLDIRFDNFNGDIYVPIRDEHGKLWSLEKIERDGTKRSHPGGRKSGNYHVVGSLERPTKLFFAEGFATAASIHLATGIPVVCTFGIHGFKKICALFRRIYPDATLIICGDRTSPDNENYLSTEKSARENACATIYPRFQNTENNPTDFNDLHTLQGLNEVASQLSQVNLPAETEISHDFVMAEGYPDEDAARGTKRGTEKNIGCLIKRLRINVRYNVISKQIEIIVPGMTSTIDNQMNASLSHLLDWCNRVKIPTENLKTYLIGIADKNPYNPVATWIESEPWDRKSRLEELYATIVSKDESLKNILMRKWLISAVAAAYEFNGISAHGVLVFQGEQYIGKTKWVKSLCPKDLGVIADGMTLRTDDKDSVFQVISKWIVELGELDATFKKSDISQLKSFITKDHDVMRRPFAPAESHFARRTVFFASVNEPEFLNDPTGNRRFWTIACEKIDHSHSVNMQQLWAEVRELYLKGESWYLSIEEMNLLNEHNEQFHVHNIDPIVQLIEDYCDWEHEKRTMRMNATSMCRSIGITVPNIAQVRAAAGALRRLTGQKNRRTDRTFDVPFPKGMT